MAIPALGFSCRSHFPLRSPLFTCVRPRSVAAVEALDEPDDLTKDNDNGNGKVAEWKKLNSRELGITTTMITRPTRKVLNVLKQKGYQVYLVGGCVRDLVLRRTPKDFDIIISAELKEVRRAFSWCEIVGKRFPICHVHIDDTIVEVQTVIPPSTSFQEDCARILRETAHFVKNLSSSISRLDKGRLLMELNYMLAYGSAEASLRLLWKFGLLKILLPIQAEYLVQNGFRRRDKRSNMLLSLFSNMDKLLAPNRPCDSSLCTCLEVVPQTEQDSHQVYAYRVGILAFHKALYDRPRDPLVVAAFSLAVHNGRNISEAVNIVRTITKPRNESFHELLEPRNMDSQALTNEVMDLAASVKRALSNMTDEQFVSQAMARCPKAPYSDLVFVPLALYLKVQYLSV
ncbi:hypothetical protein FNV43_RR21283 [Rhamnella rubrinervis]|uniref:Poly(A) polymerase n=1 Tax=Rhamnella rubrinervis TaxID=2594499 RepID=A0A8K0GUY6_9ROSA|nr:hypothetical protein FNV43_RR21283 [Rhamnella rubrinervis]